MAKMFASAGAPVSGTPISSAQAAGASRAEVLRVALVAGVFGAALVFFTGFAGADVLHAVAHDWRHAMAFPCH
ncbi:CbtB domain-containing protein [Chthonobacter rhizosphaerae]|uniref:CbtB domain-containing protein n=1 Tax=Chthonobacter rhizosphaerae TaxID=2735553 RepID=UPI001FE7132F|nr:CbtB-domain containing protein [Chthonobacter rhizosphaerae]